MSNFKTLKNKLKKLEPVQIASNWFGDIELFSGGDDGYGYFGKTAVYGYSGGLCCNYLGGGFHDSLQEGLSQITKNLRKYTADKCNVLITEKIDGKLYINTIYELDGNKIINKYPEGINRNIADLWQQPTETAKMSNEEWLSYFGTI